MLNVGKRRRLGALFGLCGIPERVLLRQVERGNGEARRRNDANAMDEDAPDRGERRQALAKAYREMGGERPREVYLQLAADRLLRATYSEKQLQETMVDFWSNHFNVYARKNVSQWFLPAFDREVIRPHALGKFRDLLLASAQSPAMLFYLDNYESVSPNADLAGKMDGARRDLSKLSDEQLRAVLTKRRGLSAAEAEERIAQLRGNPDRSLAQRLPDGINENYAREIMQLMSIGLVELNLDGTPKLSGSSVQETYSNDDVTGMARVFTGWVYDTSANTVDAPYAFAGRPMVQNPLRCEFGEKRFLGVTIPAGQDGVASMKVALDTLPAVSVPLPVTLTPDTVPEMVNGQDPEPLI